jgi:hypothetical protein
LEFTEPTRIATPFSQSCYLIQPHYWHSAYTYSKFCCYDYSCGSTAALKIIQNKTFFFFYRFKTGLCFFISVAF